MDIWLDNICYDADNSHVILIDLDRSCAKISEANYVSCSYGNLTMYSSANASWTTENLDWRQLAIMIQYIILKSPDPIDYHQIKITSEEDGFLYTLFNEG